MVVVDAEAALDLRGLVVVVLDQELDPGGAVWDRRLRVVEHSVVFLLRFLGPCLTTLHKADVPSDGAQCSAELTTPQNTK